MVKGRKICALMLASLLTLTACGDKKTEVTDYGVASETDSTASEKDEIKEGSGKKLSEMLGGTRVKYNNSFNVDGRNVSINVSYDVKEADNLSIIKVEKVDGSKYKEEEIVKNVLGDSATPLNTENRNKLSEEDGDSETLIQTIQFIMSRNHESISMRDHSCPSWNDGATYYYHTYEGTRNGMNYQLMVSYSEKFDEFVVAFYPTDFSQIAENDDADAYGYIYPDGNFYYYKGTTLSHYEADEIGGGKPNKCTKSDKELTDLIKNDLKEIVGVDVPSEGISLSENLYGMIATVESNPGKSELVFFNIDKASSGDLSSAVRDGYQASVMNSICNQRIMADPDVLDYESYITQGSLIFVNDSGIIGMSFSSKYQAKETVSESVDLISFEKAMDSAVPAIQEHMDPSKFVDVSNNITIRDVELMYYPIQTEENSNEYLMTPVWALEVRSKGGEPRARFIINATDGSYIKTLLPAE